MKILALEMSSARSGLALLDDGHTVLSRCWEERRGAERPLVQHLEEVCRAAGGWEAIEVFAAGRGPGGYTGLRIALTTIRALALPGAGRVYVLSSGEAVAAAVLEDGVHTSCMVVGDARRGTWWCGLFHPSETGPVQDGDWAVCAPEAFAARCPAGCAVAGPDWDRLADRAEDADLAALDWIREPVYPDAERLGRCVASRLADGRTSEEPLPLYLHPPVAPA